MSIPFSNLSPIEKAKILVNHEVILNVSYMVSKLVRDETYLDELCPVLSRECFETGLDAAGIRVMKRGAHWIYRFGEEDSVEYSTQQDAIEAAASSHDIEPETIEALEHYCVTSWLADRLEERGEMIVRDFLDTLNIWGRPTSCQHISLDCVIGEIAAAKYS